MDFEDQKIAAMRNEEKKHNYSNLETGIYAGDQLIKFSERKLYKDKISLHLPDNFFEMSLEEAKQKYSSESRPPIILTDAGGMANLTFNVLQEQVPPALLGGALLQFQMLIQKVQPSNEFMDRGTFEAKNMSIHWFDFRSAGLDFSVYNLLWVSSLEGQLLLGMFNSPMNMCQTWKFIFLQVLETLTDLTVEGTENEGTEAAHHAI